MNPFVAPLVIVRPDLLSGLRDNHSNAFS